MPERVESGLEARGGFALRRADGRGSTSLAERLRCASPEAGLPAVRGQGGPVAIAPAFVEGIERVSYLSVQDTAPRREDLGECDLPDARMAEIESLVGEAKDAPA